VFTFQGTNKDGVNGDSGKKEWALGLCNELNADGGPIPHRDLSILYNLAPITKS
jgi:hypothetical protein